MLISMKNFASKLRNFQLKSKVGKKERLAMTSEKPSKYPKIPQIYCNFKNLGEDRFL